MYILRVKPLRLEQLHKRRFVQRLFHHIHLLYVVIMVLVIIDLVWIYIGLFVKSV